MPLSKLFCLWGKIDRQIETSLQQLDAFIYPDVCVFFCVDVCTRVRPSFKTNLNKIWHTGFTFKE